MVAYLGYWEAGVVGNWPEIRSRAVPLALPQSPRNPSGPTDNLLLRHALIRTLCRLFRRVLRLLEFHQHVRCDCHGR